MYLFYIIIIIMVFVRVQKVKKKKEEKSEEIIIIFIEHPVPHKNSLNILQLLNIPSLLAAVMV